MSDVDSRVSALLGRMNLDQKIGQLVQAERQFITPEEVKEYHVGSVLSGGGSTPGDNTPEDWVAMNDAYWAASMDEGEGYLAIPLIYGVDAIHGNGNVRGAVIFPHNIGLGAARDPDLIERVAWATAREIAAIGVEWTFAPTLAVARNDHWGRTYESYSESSELVQAYAPRFVKGLQGDLGDEHVIACAKHWVGDGATRHGIDQGDVGIAEEELRRIHMAPFRRAVDAGVLTVMASLNSWNQVKCHGHKYLLTDVLKNEFGFDGLVVSDWDGIDCLADDYAEAAAIGLNAGLDLFMITDKWKQFVDHVKAHVASGRIATERLDDAVGRILRVKHRFGLFEKARPSRRKLAQGPSCFGSKEHREVAREAVRKSLVLLKNDGGVLPLSKSARVLVAGKGANNRGVQCGGFTIAWQGVNESHLIEGGTSVWEGIKAVAPHAVLSEDGTGREADGALHDVALVVLGELPYAEMLGDVRVEGLTTGNGTPAQHAVKLEETAWGHRIDSALRQRMPYASMPTLDKGPYGTHLSLHELHPEDLAALETIAAKGVPVVAVMLTGRPLVIERELEASRAFVVAWLPGSEGQGVADVLFGDFDFQGRLSFSWPRSDDENWNVGDENYEPRFPFGYGLTYAK